MRAAFRFPAPPRLWDLRPSRRQIRSFLTVFAVVFLAGVITAMGFDAASAATGDVGDPTTPTGVGDFIPLGSLGAGSSKTLFESTSYLDWQIDTELTFPLDFIQVVMNSIVNILQLLLVGLVYCAVALSWWLFSLVAVDGISESITSMMGNASGVIMQTLFPTAVAAGAGVAYVQRKAQGPGAQFGQVTWLALSIIFALSLSQSSGLWVSGVDKIRTSGAELVMTATTASVSSNETEPIPWPAASYNGTTTQNTLRKSADSIWRTLVVTPWCITNFGSLEACKQYGATFVAKGTDLGARNDLIKDTVYVTEGDGNAGAGAGKDSATGQWTKGENWAGRMGVVVIALIVALIFSILLIVLAFASLAALIMTWFLLYVGVFFSLLWVIPGKPRQWGVLWFEALIGALLGGIAAMLVFGTLLVVLTALFANLGTMGWAPTAGLGLVAALVAFTLRGRIMSILGSSGAGGSAFLGMMLVRSGGKAAGKIGGAVGGWGSRVGRNAGRKASAVRDSLRENSTIPPTNPAFRKRAEFRPQAGPTPGTTATNAKAPAPRPKPASATTAPGPQRARRATASNRPGPRPSSAQSRVRFTSGPATASRRTAPPRRPEFQSAGSGSTNRPSARARKPIAGHRHPAPKETRP